MYCANVKQVEVVLSSNNSDVVVLSTGEISMYDDGRLELYNNNPINSDK